MSGVDGGGSHKFRPNSEIKRRHQECHQLSVEHVQMFKMNNDQIVGIHSYTQPK